MPRDLHVMFVMEFYFVVFLSAPKKSITLSHPIETDLKRQFPVHPSPHPNKKQKQKQKNSHLSL